MSEEIRPFRLEVPQAELDDLKRRLAATRWPEKETVGDWAQGAPLAAVRALVEHWAGAYDWRRCEAMLNGFGQFTTTIDGLSIHFLHVKSPVAGAMPLLMTHGWPGSPIEFHKVIGPLTDPVAHGGEAADAFDVVIPCLPGYGFSEKPSATGWNLKRVAAAWGVLMQRLGYTRWVAQGGDWGAMVTQNIGALAPEGLAGIHVNMLVAPFPAGITDPTPTEKSAIASLQAYQSDGNGYARQQATRPQTLAYGLTDSPAGQAAWIYEKFYEWTDNDGTPESVLTRDEMLDNIMLYWLPGTGGSSGRLYWEAFRAMTPLEITVPVGVSVFPHEIFRTSRRWAEAGLKTLVYFNELEKGGHFAAFEQPALFVDEVRKCFRLMR